MIWTWLNWTSVFLYGIILVLSFLKIKLTSKNVITALLLSIGCISLQLILVNVFGFETVNKAYPFIVHLPLCLLCILYYKKSSASTIFAILASYMLTIPRNWIGVIFASIFSDVPYILDISKFFITIPLLILLLKFWTPGTWSFLNQQDRVLWIQMLPFSLFYILSYATTVYTQILYQTNIIVIGFLMTMFALSIFILSSVVGRQNAKVMTLQQQQELLSLQSSETKLRLEQIKQSQQYARVIRHDTRHYLQMIENYASKGDISAIREYIHNLDKRIDETKVEQYCLNEKTNLVLSSYVGKARNHGIDISIYADIPENLNEERNLDLCILLANAMENAATAAAKTDKPWIKLQAGMVGEKLVIHITNSCNGMIKFENGLPKSNHSDHGFGTYSISMLAEKYGGTADFTCEDSVFTVRAVI